MKDVFTLTHPRRFWLTSVTVAVIGTAGVFPFLVMYPWVVCVPIVVGGAAVVAAEFIFPVGLRQRYA